MIVGTAGHVDHGKTSLVKALTGIDTDRLPEEKRRGITLELGFAHWPLPSGRTVGVVDVPGHERFIKAMVAGAGGVDVAMLVVAADEGVMPQTREHVDICSLLGVRAGVLVVSKGDLLPGLGDGWLDLLEADLRKLVEGTAFEGAPLIVVSARTGSGLDELTRAVDAQCGRLEVPGGRGADAPLFLPIDRAFTIKGFGLVVTGTLWSGKVSVGDELTLLPEGRVCRVRGVQVHGAAVETALSGSRVAVNLPDLSVDAVARGHALVRRDELPAARVVDVELAVLPSVSPPLGKRVRLLASIGTAQLETIVASQSEGAHRFAQLRFTAPVAAIPGQRFVLRGRGTTLAGGTVLTLNPPRRRRGDLARLEQLATAQLEERLRLLLVEAGYAGLDEKSLVARARAAVKEVQRALEKASAQGKVVLIEREGRRLVAGEVLAALEARAMARLEALHAADAERTGVPREELRQKLGEPPEKVFGRVIEGLLTSKKVESVGELLRLPGKGRAFTEAVAARQTKVKVLLDERGLNPPTLVDFASMLRLSEAEVVQTAQSLVAQGVAVKAGDLFFSKASVDAVHQKLIDWFSTHERMSTQHFKELTGLSRKFLIPLAEYFDRERITLRVGDERVLRRKS